jgi:hypothetical protein
VFEILRIDVLFGEGTQNYASKFFFFIFDLGEEMEPFHLFPCALFAVAMIEVDHEEGYSLLGRCNLLPFTPRSVLFFFLFLRRNLISLA